MFVAGFQRNFDPGVKVVEVLTPLSKQVGFGTPFGTQSSFRFRGYSGLDIQGNALAASYDIGETHADGLQLFNVTDPNNTVKEWSFAVRGIAGPSFDPGFEGSTPGVGYTTIGSGRRGLLDQTTGSELVPLSTGFIWWPGSPGTINRDMDFAPNGDLYVRHNNAVAKTVRTGPNSSTAQQSLFDGGANAIFNGQNLAYVSSFGPFADFLIYNDVQSSAPSGQLFADVVKFMDPDGNDLAAEFHLLGPSIADGSGYYDFDYDPATSTLALLDQANGQVHIFAIPEADSLIMLATGFTGAFLLGWRKRGPVE